MNGGDEMRTRTEVEETQGRCRMENTFNADTGEWLSRKVYDANNRVAATTFNYNKAHKVLMKVARRGRYA